MRIIVFGGAGDMGSRAVEDLAAREEVELVTIADRDTVKAQRLAARLGSRVKTVEVDADDLPGLAAAMAGHQVAAGALGPFYRYERTLVEAALVAGTDYVSICDDHDALQSVQELDLAAKERGLRIISGVGWTPGISNLLAVRGAAGFDRLEAIRIYWAGSSADSSGLAVILHTIHIFTGDVPTFRDGQLVTVRAGSEKERVRFPPPLGEVNTYHLGHPEPLTLPRRFPGVSTVSLKGGLVESHLNVMAIMMSRLGLTSTDRRKQRLGLMMKKILPPLDRLFKGLACSGIKVVLEGEKDGLKRKASMEAAAPMRELTGLPLAVTAVMLARGQISATGVIAPEAEGGINQELFFAELAQRGIKILGSGLTN
jgi:saccharopine dehydrogenase-like NADP-dependent oxidoreductase